MEKPVIRISVRRLVEFILQSGDLVSGGSRPADKEAMLKGGKLHRKLQKSAGSGYRSEVSLKRESEYPDLILCIEGRADGVFTEEGLLTVDEIKGVYRPLETLEEPVLVHKAQAMCYALILGLMEKKERIGVRMTYIHLDTEEIRRFQETFTIEELWDWYEDLTGRYYKWVSYAQQWQKQRNASILSLRFPFPYRPGQKKMVSGIYKTLSEGKQLFMQAPTGIGKTMSAVFPAVWTIGEGKGERLFYLTARTIARTVAEDAFRLLEEKGLLFKTITLTAKEKLCLNGECTCDPKVCPYAKGHYDRILDAVFSLWTTRNTFDRDTILEHAREKQVCPFEMSLDLSLWLDGIICDYNYVFDPDVQLRRFFADGAKGEHLFLIDEAHNLVERGREMYSASLCRETLVLQRKALSELHHDKKKSLQKTLETIDRQLLRMKKECREYERMESLETSFSLSLTRLFSDLQAVLEEPPAEGLPETFLELFFSVRSFMKVTEMLDDHYVIYTSFDEEGHFFIKLFCVNPAGNLQKCLDQGRGTVFFSATLLPMEYYRSVLSEREETYGMALPSPFPVRNRRILLGTDVSTLYKRRGYEEYRKLAEYISKLIRSRKGNYMLFFPSYKLMEDVYEVYQELYEVPWVETILQSPAMGEEEKEAFLERFSEREGTLAGFCVMGGSFAEGIDLMGEKLIGAAVIGTGIPQISCERSLLKEYFDQKGQNGFDYAYRYPGMNKVLQSAGRVIRTDTDTGVILLLDERFGRMENRSLLPMEGRDARICHLDGVEEDVKEFWKGLEDGRKTDAEEIS